MSQLKEISHEITGIGIDGCRGGWLVCLLRDKGLPEFKVLKTLHALQEYVTTGRDVFIDMPFGLSSNGLRACDTQARRLLGKRRATIFLVPCRIAVYAHDFKQACQLNQQCCGKKISMQVWNLVPEIRELDQFLRKKPKWQKVFFESHPELCFSSLNHGEILETSKKTREGQEQRLRLLQNIHSIEWNDLMYWREKLGKSRVKIDDLLDAMVLAICASFPSHQRYLIPEQIQKDQYGLSMNIVGIQAQNSERKNGDMMK